MKKKLAALVLAATMVMGTGLTVCAEGNVTDMAGAAGGQEITGSSETNVPIIDITVPTTTKIIINPFEMEYIVDEEAGTKESKQIICVPQEIVNASNVAVAVNVKELYVKDMSDGILISTAALTSKVTTKSAFLYLEVVEDGKSFSEYKSTNSNQVVIPYIKEGDIKTKKGDKDSVATLAADGGKAQFAINGAVIANPTKVNDDKSVTPAPWLATDEINVSFKFTFTPQSAAASK